VAGSLSMLTRTIGTVTGAAALTLLFHALEAGALTRGSDTAAAFLDAFRGTFRLVGVAVAASALAIPWWRQRLHPP
jgi:hypothetical protein